MKNKKFILLVALAVLLIGLGLLLKLGNLGTGTLWQISQGGTWLLPLVVVSALIDSVNPCAFSVLLLTIAFLLSIGQLRRKILTIGASYIFGVFVVYILNGLGILQTLHLFNTPHFMAKVGAGLLIGLGVINLINEFFPQFPIKLRIPAASHRRMAALMEQGSLPAVFLLGVLVGLCEFPCTGGPYLMILGLLHDKMTYLRGLGYLALYNLIFILPLVLILGMASNPVLLSRVEAWKRAETRPLRASIGIVMIGLGILIFFL